MEESRINDENIKLEESRINDQNINTATQPTYVFYSMKRKPYHSLFLTFLTLAAALLLSISNCKEILEKEAGIQPDEVASPPHGLTTDDSIIQSSATKVAFAKLHESNNDGEDRDLATVPGATPSRKLSSLNGLINVIMVVFNFVTMGVSFGNDLATFLGGVNLEDISDALAGIGQHLKEMRDQLDAIEKKLDLLLVGHLRIKFENVQIIAERDMAIINQQFNVMADMVSRNITAEWIDGERLRSTTSNALTSLIAVVNGDYGLLPSLVKTASALENDVSGFRNYWSTIELYRSRCKNMMLVGLTVLYYCNGAQNDSVSNSTLTTQAKAVVESIETMYKTTGVAPLDGVYLHIKGRKYVLAKFRHNYCGSDGWDEQLKKTGVNFWRAGFNKQIIDCISPIYEIIKPDHGEESVREYYGSGSIYDELVIARDAYLASTNYDGQTFEQAFSGKHLNPNYEFLWSYSDDSFYGAWGYHATFQARICMCRCESQWHPVRLTSYTYKISVKGNDIRKHEYDTFPVTCDEILQDNIRPLVELDRLTKLAFTRAYNFVRSKPSYYPNYHHMLLKIEDELDAGGRLVSWDPDAIDAAARSVS